MTTLKYLIGRSGTGKYTIANELAKQGYKIADNHLVNNTIFSLLDLVEDGTIPDYAWEAVAQVRKGVFQFISNQKSSNFILTNELFDDDAGDHECYAFVEEIANKRGSVFVPVKLIISNEENRRRIIQPERKQRYKSMKIDESKLQRELIKVQHLNLLELNISHLSAEEAACKILEHLRKI